ncbi:MAG: D-amino acid aminotransferase [Gammaproteobacteria bacterium]|nr:D-amino acid aminotransferase [Gammaproteobacteria bacterium]
MTIYLNGDYLPLAEAKISVLDRAFIFGDGVYEVMPVYAGRPFRLTQHLQRLEQSLRGIGMSNPMANSDWEARFTTLIDANGGGDMSLYLQISRGVAPRDHRFPEAVTPTIFIMTNPLPAHDNQPVAGVSVITLEDIRWQQCHIKATALLANVLLRQQAVAAGVTEAILLAADELTEGAASNVFIVTQGVIMTPPKSPKILPGITRDLVLELAAAQQLPAQECTISRTMLHQADEIWLTSSTKEIVPVCQIDDNAVATGAVGPIWQQMNQHYQNYKDRFRRGEV